jgi:transcriptional regulator with XRE-family HTH domain
MNKSIGKVIKAIRKHLNYTQKRLAQELNITTATIANMENGRVRIDVDRLQLLSVIFQVSLANMLALAAEIEKNGNEVGLAKAIKFLQRSL